MRACLKCKQYVLIHPDNFISSQIVNKFEKDHARHTIVTTELSEVRDFYTNVQKSKSKSPVKVSGD